LEGKNMSAYIIAEIGINHNGSMQIATELIDKATEAGCNAVKFQKRNIDEVYSKEELDKPRESPWGTTTRQQKEGLEFSMDQYEVLYNYAKADGLDFIVSCWDTKSVDDIEKVIKVDYHKIASALLTDKELLQKINATGKKVILSTGMSTYGQVCLAVHELKNLEYILSCTSTYPTKPEEVNVSRITTLKRGFPGYKIGFSNHYSGLDACVLAAGLGAEAIEFHITLDRAMYGSDQAASIENAKDLVNGIRHAEQMVGDGMVGVYPSEVPSMKKLRKVDTLK
jgi:N-acetylneuraminate synthase